MVMRGESYDPLTANRLIRYFDVEPKVTEKDGKVEAIDFPTLEGFCGKYKIPKRKLMYWAEQYEEVKEAIEFARDKMKEVLFVNGLSGRYQ
jgi:hypothetical protein